MTTIGAAGLVDGADVGDGLPVDVVVECDSRLCYALSINRRPPVRSLTIRARQAVLRGTLTITVSSEWTAADRPPLRTLSQVVAAPRAGESITVDVSNSRLDDLAVAYLDEPATATLIVHVEDSAGRAHVHREELLILARNRWVPDLGEIPAAFVQSAHPDVPVILRRATELLQQRTGSEALVGYQWDRERVMASGAAIYDALGERIDAYVAGSTNSYAVRTLDQILATGQGNCIDLACAFASCALAAGLRPLIFLVHGHAFGGFYAEPPAEGRCWNRALTTDLASIEAVHRLGAAVPLETTAMAGRSASFDWALDSAARHFAQRMENCENCRALVQKGAPADSSPHMEAVLDVAFARAQGILSLPVRSIVDGVEVLVVDQGRSNPPLVERRDPRTRVRLAESVPIRIQRWQTALLDLTRRSPLISFDALSQGIHIRCGADYLGAIEDHLVGGGQITIHGDAELSAVFKAAGITSWTMVSDDDVRQNWEGNRVLPGVVQSTWREPSTRRSGTPTAAGEAEQQLAGRARTLVRRARAAEAETGVNNLALALGTVTWPYEGAGRAGVTETVTSPVFLIPIRMSIPPGDRPPSITLAEEAMTTVNLSLLEALRRKFGLRLAWFNDDLSDDVGLDIDGGLNALRRELMESGLADTGLSVDTNASIGVFPFQNVRLWKDLTDHWQEFLRNPVVRHLVESEGTAFVDPADTGSRGAPDFTDWTLLNPQPADSAQTRAIVRALAGQSFVLEGPPGTGKSQTITNLLANALSRGQKVLFVAEKPEARSVVWERLQQVGLDSFCLYLNDQGASPQVVKDQIREALDFTPTDVEQRWAKADSEFQHVANALAAYRDRIHGPGSGGLSYFDVHLLLMELSQAPVARIGRAVSALDRSTLEAIRATLVDLPPLAEAAVLQARHPWSLVNATGMAQVDLTELAGLIAGLDGVLAAVADLPQPWAEAFAACQTPHQAQSLLAVARLMEYATVPVDFDWRAVIDDAWFYSVHTALETIAQGLAAGESLGLPSTLLLRDLTHQCLDVEKAASSMFLGRRGRVEAALGDLLEFPEFRSLPDAQAVWLLSELAQAALRYQEGLSILRGCEGMNLLILGEPLDEGSLCWLRDRMNDLRTVGMLVDRNSSPGDEAVRDRLRACVEHDVPLPEPERVAAWVEFTERLLAVTRSTEHSLAEWQGGGGLLATLALSAPAWREDADAAVFLRLRRWVAVLHHLQGIDRDLFADFRGQLLRNEIPAEDALRAFNRTYLEAVLRDISEERSLDVFAPAKHDRQIERMLALTTERQALLRSLIPARLHAIRATRIGSASHPMNTLRSQLALPRRGARSIRSLIATFPDLIAEVTPCFLMGPDSVAKFIPANSITFDLVVFDEASQIRVEEAIGTMGRGRAVVIVGDSRQMPPSAAFTIAPRQEHDDVLLGDPLPLAEAESILEEAVEAGLPREMLSWHYRSQDEVLIAFSNERYYEGRLSSFPSPFSSRPGVGISYRRVEGQFIHGDNSTPSSRRKSNGPGGGALQTNPIEAGEIVSEVRRRAHDPQTRSLTMGIVTLNRPQADLIQRLLEELNDPVITGLLDHEDPAARLIVVNLENVQGRERDVILLGTSFSNRLGTDRMPLTFGPLTLKGGERRLNVAVTRARRQVMVFSSFDPHQLSSARSLGMRHLYEYLTMAQQASRDRTSIAGLRSGKTDPHAAEVGRRLQEAGLTTQVGYGLSQFTIDVAVGSPRRPNTWLVAVLLDGHEWAARSLVLDRDCLPETVLRGTMGWPAICRIWLPSWRQDPAPLVAGVVDLVEEQCRLAGPIAESAPTSQRQGRWLG